MYALKQLNLVCPPLENVALGGNGEWELEWGADKEKLKGSVLWIGFNSCYDSWFGYGVSVSTKSC